MLEYDPAGHDVHAEVPAGVDAKAVMTHGAGLRKSIRIDLCDGTITGPSPRLEMSGIPTTDFGGRNSDHRLRAWPGVGDGGRAAGRGVSATLLAANFGPGLDGAVEGCAALAWSLPFYLSLTGLSTGGQAMLGRWSQHHLRL